jgi:hypothetical protein
MRVRNAATNMTKAEIWETITQMFIQVRFSTAFVCQFWLVSQEIRITAVDIFMYINMNTDMSRARTLHRHGPDMDANLTDMNDKDMDSDTDKDKEGDTV